MNITYGDTWESYLNKDVNNINDMWMINLKWMDKDGPTHRRIGRNVMGFCILFGNQINFFNKLLVDVEKLNWSLASLIEEHSHDTCLLQWEETIENNWT